MDIPKYIPIRNDIPIKNSYELIINSTDDFHIVIYYINDYKCKIIIRRLDEPLGWDVNILIKINNSIISLGSSTKNEKIMFLKTIFKLEKINIYSHNNIPKRIVQTSRDNRYVNILHYNAVHTFLELNPEYDYIFFTDKDCREFIKNNFEDDVLTAYDILYPGAYKADLFRYCYIYIEGGCYFDNKYILRMPLREIIRPEYNNVFCKDTFDDLMFNSIIMSIAKTDELRNSINKIIENVKNKHYGKISLEPTGPKLFNIYTHNQNVLLYHSVLGKHYTGSKVSVKKDNRLFCNTHYKGYYYNPSFRQITYNDLFLRGEIYYLNMVKINKYVILVFPHHTPDRFNFTISDNKIKIIRTDEDKGWGQDLKIKIIDDETNNETILDVGRCSDNNISKYFI